MGELKRTFNANGVCYPDEHYMVDLESRIVQVNALLLSVSQRCIIYIFQKKRQAIWNIIADSQLYRREKGYLISFNFNKKKSIGIERIFA